MLTHSADGHHSDWHAFILMVLVPLLCAPQTESESNCAASGESLRCIFTDREKKSVVFV